MNQDEMTTKEVSRLIDWLKAEGYDMDKIEECIDHISQEQPKENADKKA